MNGEKISASELLAFCQSRLPYFECPKSIEFLDEIPKSPSGKLLRRKLVETSQKR